GSQLLDHRVDGVLQLENFTAGIDGDLLREVSGGDRGGDRGDVADLVGQVTGQHVHVVGQVAPGAGRAGHLGLSAQLPFGTYFAGHAGDFRSERAQLIDHHVDGVFELEDLALGVDGDLLAQVAVGDGGRHQRDVAD